MSDQAVPVISHNPALLPSLPYAFHAPMAFEGPHKFDASQFVGAFQKPDGGASWTRDFAPRQEGFVSRTNSAVSRGIDDAATV